MAETISGNGKVKGPRAQYALAEIIANAVYSRASFAQKFLDRRRDLDNECGYPKTEELNCDHYRMLYDREPIATKVVDLLPRESWKVQPKVYEDEDAEKITEFEEAWDALGLSLLGEESWYQEEAGSPLWEYLERIDRLAGIGHYGVLLLGLDDGAELSEEAKKGGNKLLYLRAFDESLAKITRYETDSKSPRYGQPVEYNLSFSDPSQNMQSSIGFSIATKLVHWSRIIHVADNLGSSEVLGVPRLRPVYNRVYDLYKLYGGSAEMYWKGAFPGMGLEPTTGVNMGDVEIDVEAIKDQLEQYFNGLDRAFFAQGLSAKMLSPTVVDPTGQINAAIQAICIQLDCPQRIFMGSERGELASSQDASSWNTRLARRRERFVTPRLIVPFVNRCIFLGVLPEPKSYIVYWPQEQSLGEQEKATIAVTKTDALTKYVSGGVEAMITPMDYLTRFLEFEEEEAKSMLEAAEEEKAVKEEEEAAKAEEAAAAQEEAAAQGGGLEDMLLQIVGEGGAEEEGVPPKGVTPPQLAKPAIAAKKAAGNEAGKSTRPFEKRPVAHVFCPKGKGSGVDPTCSPKRATRSMAGRIVKQGGFTFIYAQQKYKQIGESGWSVSPYKSREVRISGRRATKSDLQKYMASNKGLLQKKGHAVGTWFDEASKTTYLDVAIVMKGRRNARAIGCKHRQEAIFGFKNGKTVRLRC